MTCTNSETRASQVQCHRASRRLGCIKASRWHHLPGIAFHRSEGSHRFIPSRSLNHSPNPSHSPTPSPTPSPSRSGTKALWQEAVLLRYACITRIIQVLCDLPYTVINISKIRLYQCRVGFEFYNFIKNTILYFIIKLIYTIRYVLN